MASVGAPDRRAEPVPRFEGQVPRCSWAAAVWQRPQSGRRMNRAPGQAGDRALAARPGHGPAVPSFLEGERMGSPRHRRASVHSKPPAIRRFRSHPHCQRASRAERASRSGTKKNPGQAAGLPGFVPWRACGVSSSAILQACVWRDYVMQSVAARRARPYRSCSRESSIRRVE